MAAPTLSAAAQRRMRRDPDHVVATWHRDEQAFQYLADEHAARSYVKWQEYWSQWTAEDEDGVNQRARDHVKSARHWEDMQVAQARTPVGYWLTHADGTVEWVEPAAPVERTAAAADANRKGTAPMTGAERVRLSRWRKRATASGWVCPTHSTQFVRGVHHECTLDCADLHLSEREAATGRKAASASL